ncbi:MAG: peptidylprolyl isomerase [Alphaproteobacteria bacterium]|nr:peptidylprolyl isomerase [Alphaproteobacteria bacterium]
MIKHVLRVAALCCPLLVTVTAVAAPNGDPIIAVVNGKEIHHSALDRLMESQPQLQKAPLDKLYPQLLDHLVATELLAAEGRKANLQNDPDVKAQLKDREDLLVRRAYLTKQVTSKITDEMLKDHYQTLIKKMPPKEEVHARHILVDSEDKAKAAITEIKGGADFAKVAEKVSTDGSKEHGGDLGFFTKDEMVAPFAEAAFKLKAGEMTDEPVKSPFGWHVIKVEERRMATPPKFDDVKDEVRTMVAESMVRDLVTDLRSKAKVKTFKADGSPDAPAK